ncbi:hypothetical protein SteCoe_34917 [Stentor coeruleus]|uniref:AI-2E family transporter n=1 Tax=Stentor coeruleus TaxID=5963 RepID=A0A1R2ATF5_9CILI|nr:hypothetical protein SteCoe_34917 [Stentor coeruleus]
MDGYVDYKLVRSIILAVAVCMAFWSTASMLYSLLQGFIDIFAIALVTSLAIRPVKDWINAQIIIAYGSTSNFPMFESTLLFYLPSSVNLCKNTTFSLLFIPFLSYLIYKSSVLFILGVFLIIISADLILKFLFGFMVKSFKLLKLYEPINQNHLFDSVLTIFLMITLIVLALLLQTAAIGSVVIELTEHGKSFFDWCSDFFDAELLENLSESSYLAALEKNFGDTWRNLTKQSLEEAEMCSSYITSIKEMPIVGEVMFNFLLDLEEWLNMFQLSTNHLAYVVLSVPQNFDLIWKIVSTTIKLLFSNIGGVAFTISAILERVILYLTLVYILVKDKTSILEKCLNLIPLEKKIRFEILDDIINTIFGISTSFLLAASAHYSITLWAYYALDLELKHTFAVLTAMVGLFPFFGAWFVNMPMIIWKIARWDYSGLVLFLIEYFIVGQLDGMIYSAQLESYNPTLVGIVIVLGIYKFGTFGIFYGPLILSFGYMIFKLAKQLNTNN